MKFNILLILIVYTCSFSTEAGFLSKAKQKVGGFLFGSKKCTKFNMDCLLLVVEELDFLTLLNMAQTNKFFADFAVKIYERKFSNQTIVIDHYSSLNLHKYLEMGIEKIIDVMDQHSDIPLRQMAIIHHHNKDDGDVIKINNMNVAFNALKYFGKYIQKLKINTEDADADRSTVISRLLNKYCSESLVELGFRIDRGDALNYFTTIFKNVERINFERYLPIMEYGVLPMNETFPALRTLSVSLLEVNSDYLFNQFPNLEHLKLDLGICGNATFVFELFKFNRHIRSVELLFATSQHLLLANMILRELEHITLEAFDLTNGIMFFPFVSKFTMADMFSNPINLIFMRLQELEIHFCPVRFGEWMEFLRQHNALIKFHINYFFMDDEYFERLTIGLFNLQEMTIVRLHGKYLAAATIAGFIENHEHLIKLDLESACSDSDYRILYDKFKHEWNISYDAERILFERNLLIH